MNIRTSGLYYRIGTIASEEASSDTITYLNSRKMMDMQIEGFHVQGQKWYNGQCGEAMYVSPGEMRRIFSFRDAISGKQQPT